MGEQISTKEFIKNYLRKHSFGDENDAVRETYRELIKKYQSLRQGKTKRFIRYMWRELND